MTLQACQIGWGASLHSDFQVSAEIFGRVQFQALAEPLKDIQRLVPEPFLHCLGYVLRVVVLLEGEPVPPETRGSRPGAVSAGHDREVCGATHNWPSVVRVRAWSVGISLSHRAQATPVAGRAQCALTKVARCFRRHIGAACFGVGCAFC